jgi:DNA-binding transcriptional MerR regulator
MEKLYYSIGEVAKMFEVNTSLIRFWEKEFNILHPNKNQQGKRLFTRKDIEDFRLIYNLVKERGYTLQGAKDLLRQKKDDAGKDVAIKATLEEIRVFLIDLKKELK